MQTGNDHHPQWPTTTDRVARRLAGRTAPHGIALGMVTDEADELGLRGVPVAIALSLPIWAILITVTVSILTWIG